MSINLTDPIFHDDEAARLYFEAQRWPNGPFCPHCGETQNVHRMEGKSHQPGMCYCRSCGKKFTVTVGSVMERSHIPLAKWALAFRLMASSKKGMSAHQLGRTLGITYKSAWFMAHRIREAMGIAKPGPLGGENKVVEADETYVGGKAKNRAYAKKPPIKQAVVSLVEREGEVRSRHVPNVTATTLRPILVTLASRKSHLMTDESAVYPAVGTEFAGHSAVNHSADEYVRLGGFVHTNTAENFFSIFKRGIYGVYHHVSEAHLGRYLAEFDFRYNARKVTDSERAAFAVRGAEGKRLLYRGPRESAHA
jgi:transposase-like protein